jgi:xylulokinase
LVPVVNHGLNGKYLALPFNNNAGIILKWFKDKFCQEEAARALKDGSDVYDLMTELAVQSPHVNKRLILLPYFSGTLSPRNDSHAAGILYGLDLSTGKGEMIKAIMESIAFLIRENVAYLKSNGFKINNITSLGGGAKNPYWLQIKSDVLDIEITTLENEESTSLGCGLVGAIELGYFDSVEKIDALIRIKRIYLPNPVLRSDYDDKFKMYLSLYDNNKSLFI